MALLPTLVATRPHKSLLSHFLFYQIERMLVKSVANFLHVPVIHQKLLEHADAVQALAKLATENVVSDKKLKSVRKIERQLFALELQVLHQVDKARAAARNAVATELTELTGVTVSQALIALEQSNDDKHAALQLLKEKRLNMKKEALKDSDSALNSEFGPVLDSYLWSAKAYSQMPTTEATQNQPELNLAGGAAGPAW